MSGVLNFGGRGIQGIAGKAGSTVIIPGSPEYFEEPEPQIIMPALYNTPYWIDAPQNAGDFQGNVSVWTVVPGPLDIPCFQYYIINNIMCVKFAVGGSLNINDSILYIRIPAGKRVYAPPGFNPVESNIGIHDDNVLGISFIMNIVPVNLGAGPVWLQLSHVPVTVGGIFRNGVGNLGYMHGMTLFRIEN